MARDKFAQNSAEVNTSNGEITFVAARSVKNLNGWTYDVKSLQAQDVSGDYKVLSSEPTEVSIPLMADHSSSIKDKIGTIDKAHIETDNGVDQVVMHANFFDTDEAQDVRQRIIDNQLTDVSITTDWGSEYSEEDDPDMLKNAHIIEVSVVYAGAEPKAKILAKNSVEVTTEKVETEDEVVDDTKVKVKTEAEVTEEPEKETQEEQTNATEDESKVEKEDAEMATQPTNKVEEKEVSKEQVLNILGKLAENGSIRKMNRSQVIAAVKNEVSLLEPDGETAYTVPDAVFTEIMAVTRPTDIMDTFATVPVKRFTLMGEVKSDADLARAGRWTKGEQKVIQASDLKAQKFSTQFLYKLQELSYEDLQEDFGDLLYAYIKNELPQKAAEEEERDFIVGDGRASNDDRHISSIVSLDAAAEDTDNVHVYDYDGSSDASDMAAMLNGVSHISEDGVNYAVMNKTTLASFRAAGLDTAAGLPFSVETVAGALGVEKIFVREYVANNVVYVWTQGYVKRLTGGSAGENIEQYDIDYNNRKIEFIKPVGGGASGLYSAVKVTLPGGVSA